MESIMKNIGKPLTPRAIEMYTFIKQYLQSDIKQKEFCSQHDLKLATFQKWLHLYRKDQQKKSTSNSEFIPIKINSVAKNLISPSGCTIEYPNGIILRIHGDIDVSVIQDLLNQD
jgi:hypothetical protein